MKQPIRMVKQPLCRHIEHASGFEDVDDVGQTREDQVRAGFTSKKKERFS